MTLYNLIKHPVFRAAFLSYSAAVISLFASVLRDYVVVSITSSHQAFFEIMYVASLISGLAINALMIVKSEKREFYSYLFLSIFSIFLWGWGEGHVTLHTQICICIIVATWLFGAILSRGILEAGKIFVGRSRETIGSLVMTFCIFCGAGVVDAFAIGAVFGMFFLLLLANRWGLQNHVFCERKIKKNGREQLRRFFCGNVAVVMVTVWAYNFNQSNQLVMGIDGSIMARGAVYIFQVLVIGVVVLIWKNPADYIRHKTVLNIALALFCVLAVAITLPYSVGVFFVPIIGALLHYASVCYLLLRKV